MEPTRFTPLTPKRVLGVVAHPDDLDVIAAGSIAKYIQGGAEVHYLVLTDGGKGSDDPAMTTEELIKTRQQEQRQGLAAIGGNPDNVHFLAYGDGELEGTLALKQDIVRYIRQYTPDTVITLDPVPVYSETTGRVNHTDHRVAGYAVIDAVFPLARDRLSFPALAVEGLGPHKVDTLLLVDFDRANYYEDITATFEDKKVAIAAHPSQFKDIDFMHTIFRQMAEHNGKQAGCTLAEGFIRLDLN